MTKKYSRVLALVAAVALLAGCGATEAPQPADAPSHQAARAVAGTQAQPPEAAAMPCSAEARQNLAKVLGLSQVPKGAATWADQLYSCTFALPDGRFVMSVKVLADSAAANAYAVTLAKSLGADPIEGLSNLGLPGYRADAGNIVFAKDNMALKVDASHLTEKVGPQGVTRANFAYEMATTILACWSEH